VILLIVAISILFALEKVKNASSTKNIFIYLPLS